MRGVMAQPQLGFNPDEAFVVVFDLVHLAGHLAQLKVSHAQPECRANKTRRKSPCDANRKPNRCLFVEFVHAGITMMLNTLLERLMARNELMFRITMLAVLALTQYPVAMKSPKTGVRGVTST